MFFAYKSKVGTKYKNSMLVFSLVFEQGNTNFIFRTIFTNKNIIVKITEENSAINDISLNTKRKLSKFMAITKGTTYF